MPMLGQQRRPCRIGREAGSWNPLFVASGNVHGEQRRSAIAAGVAEEHENAAVRRKGRSFVVESGGENPLTRAVGLHDADGKLSAALFGKGDVVAPRRPDRRRIVALPEGYTLRGSARRRHHINLRLSTAVGFETYTRPVGPIGRGGSIRGGRGEGGP